MHYIVEFVNFNIPFNQKSIDSLRDKLNNFDLVKHYLSPITDFNRNIKISESENSPSDFLKIVPMNGSLNSLTDTYCIEIDNFFKLDDSQSLNSLCDEFFDCIHMIENSDIDIVESYVIFTPIEGSRMGDPNPKYYRFRFSGLSEFKSIIETIQAPGYTVVTRDTDPNRIIKNIIIYLHFKI